MQIDDKIIDHLSTLAKLEFRGEERIQITKDLSQVLAFVDKLNELVTSGMEPLIFMSGETNVLREDEVKQDISREDALKNASGKDSDYFKVPKVLE